MFYWRPTDLLDPGAPRPRQVARQAPAVECMLLSLATESGNDHALPPITRTLPQAEHLQRQLRGRIKKRFRQFVRVRRAGPPSPVDRGYAIRLRFAEPTPGPICLGYGSHYGLGVFRAIPASAA